MEEVNETALTELVDETVGIQEGTFDYSDVTPEEESELKSFKLEKNVIDHAVIVIKGRHLKRAQEIYSKNGIGKFQKWVEEEYKMSFSMAHNYMRAYEVLENNNLLDETSNGWMNEKIKKVGAHKLSYLAGLPKTQQKEVLENAPLDEMNKKEVNDLVKKVKETGEFNPQQLEEIRQEKENLKKSAEQKDAEIKKLQKKVEELEKAQSVTQNKPEIVEKIVEVEKVVEKEVVPEKIKIELEELKRTNKALEQDNEDKASFIKEQNKQMQQQRDKISSLQIDDNIPEDSLKEMKLVSLIHFIEDFLKNTSGYTLLKGQYNDISQKSKNTLLNSVERVEDWCLLMKQAINNEKNFVGNNIIIESEKI